MQSLTANLADIRIRTALVFLCWLGASPHKCAPNCFAQNIGETLDLKAAIGDQKVRAVLRCHEPGTMRFELTNPSGKALRLRLETPLLAVPTGDRFSKWDRPRAKDRPMTTNTLLRRIRQTLDRQPGVVGGYDRRGSFGGRRSFLLPPNTTESFEVPFLATQLHIFKPDAEFTYTLVPYQDWSKDARAAILLKELGRRQAAFEVAQATLWSLLHGVSLSQLRLAKQPAINELESRLAESLVAEVNRCAKEGNAQPRDVPARIYLQVINKGGESVAPLANEIRKLTAISGFIGLPVTRGDVETVNLSTPAQIASALGCQMTLGKANGEISARVVLVRWKGEAYGPHREVVVPLGAQPTPRTAITTMHAKLIAQLVRVRRAEGENQPRSHVEIYNDFPLALHGLRLQLKLDSTAAARSITLMGYAIGPRRRLRLDLGAPAYSLEPVSATWGR